MVAHTFWEAEEVPGQQLLLCRETLSRKTNEIKEGRVYLRHTVPEGKSHHRHDKEHGTGATAEISHLKPQAGSRECTLRMEGDF